ncbi:MAG: uroporphyrinogen-III C-methyltransferase [Candidatus Zixiibacteriota bacterium]|nr:MAG: uroporphyrinogen-III C-methyltransferase [candidate division Zixibacteria bacterium]
MSPEKDNIGTVYLVGAGPGDPDLVTVKGQRLLRECDVVVYDHLIPDELIVALPERVRRIYVGKQAGHHSLPQDKLNELLARLAGDGKDVVRLKGGDPFVFGRGAEEAQYLKDRNIPFEVVPGITSGMAAAAYAGVPCTDRRVSSYVTFLTGHKAVEKKYTTVPWEWLAKAQNGTLIIYMGVKELKNNVTRLLDGGMSPDTPVIGIERGTMSTQRTINATLSQIVTKATEANLKPPSLFVVGEAAKFHEQLDWLSGRPLSNMRVMVTRPADQAGTLYADLRSLGAEVLAYPTIATEASPDRSAWSRVKDLKADERWLVFTSENGVRYFLEQWQEVVGDFRKLGDYKIASVGTGTASALDRYGFKADFVPSVATTAELAEQLTECFDIQGATVVRVRGDLADDRVEKRLKSVGASVVPLQVYKTLKVAWTAVAKEKLFKHPPHVIMFTSGSSADGFAANLSDDERERVAAEAVILSIGPITSKIIESHGLKVSLEAGKHNIPAMIEELLEYSQSKSVR